MGGEKLFHAPLSASCIVVNPWHSLACRCKTPISASVITWYSASVRMVFCICICICITWYSASVSGFSHGIYSVRASVSVFSPYKDISHIGLDFPPIGGSVVKNPPANAVNAGSIPGSGRSPVEENGNPLQCSYLENPMDGGVWWATVHGVRNSQT